MHENDRPEMNQVDVETALSRLTPVAAQVDRDALMYQAGYQAATSRSALRQGNRFWQGATGLMTAASVTLAATLMYQSPTSPPPQYVAEPALPGETQAPAEPIAADETGSSSAAPTHRPTARERFVRRTPPHPVGDPTTNYLALRAAVLQRGLETWPTEYREAVQAPANFGLPRRASTARGLLEELLPADVDRNPDGQRAPRDASTSDKESIV